jgi:hypothetical protein
MKIYSYLRGYPTLDRRRAEGVHGVMTEMGYEEKPDSGSDVCYHQVDWAIIIHVCIIA